MNISQFIADCIQQRLNKLRINRQEFAEMVDTQPSTITKWLSGSHNFTTDTLQKIQNALNVNFFAYSEGEIYCFPCDSILEPI